MTRVQYEKIFEEARKQFQKAVDDTVECNRLAFIAMVEAAKATAIAKVCENDAKRTARRNKKL